LFALSVVGVITTGCWEQVSPEWFPQMKQQPAVQAFEHAVPLMPPEGTIPIGGIAPRIDNAHPMPAFLPEVADMKNPILASAQSVQRGKRLYGIHCAICHGNDGMANLAQVPVALRMAEGGMPPFPLVTVPTRTDGFLFTKIRYGKPGMPSYSHIRPADRWNIVNYLRTLMKGPS
jgi:mono/diheme cytochrome c family protein